MRLASLTLALLAASERCEEPPTSSASFIQRSSSSISNLFSAQDSEQLELKWLTIEDAKNATIKATNATMNATVNATTRPAGWKQDLVRIQGGMDEGEKDYTAVTATAMSALITNALMCLAFLGLFGIFQKRYPLVFSGNLVDGKVSTDSENWMAASWGLDLDQIARVMGLDACMAIEYSSLGVKLMLAIGLPNLLFFSPLHRWYGEAGLEQQDLFASLSMANIKMNHPWLYHLHALAVVWVVLVVRHLVFEAQTRFVARRMSWLKSLQYPRANTVLVEEIPKAYRSREKLVKFFNENLGPVASTHLVMQTKRLEQSIELRDFAKSKLAESKASFEKEGVRPSLAKFQPFPLNFFLADTDAIEHFSEELVKYELQIKEMRDALSESRGTSTNSTHSAFVTFGSRKSAEMAKALEFSADSDWLISDAPEAEAIRWQDLAREEALSPNLVILGYVLMLLLFANFSPICLAISSTATEIHLGSLQPIWVALAPTLGLTIFLAMLPTVQLLILTNFSTLRSEPSAQHRLQVWYFRFQAICILFLPIVGSDFRSFVKQLFQDSSLVSVLRLLAERIPLSTRFFFSYIVLQWSVACIELLRMAVLGKFLLFRSRHPEEEARKMAEPEDQDFYGMGGRTARWNLNLVIGCLFCGIWPFVSLVTLVAFLLQRVAYGYLLAFAETRKADSGGEFWTESLSQLLYSMVLFAVGMCGVLLHRSSSIIPAAMAFLGVKIAVVSIWQFQSHFRWRSLPMPEVVALDTSQKAQPDAGIYKHPALKDESDI